MFESVAVADANKVQIVANDADEDADKLAA
jgi:hypothetical protein